ncbi:MAG TPA: formylglycine-generating enzyme family protein [Nitrospiria bacterium]|nr:formylglycine-generating enzyme family protein [Nitrospiria bacterium]
MTEGPGRHAFSKQHGRRIRRITYACVWVSGWLLGGCSHPSVPSGMVAVPAGNFVMGSDKVDTEGIGVQLGMIRPLYQDEHPQRKVFLPTFFIDRFEVTQAQYKVFTDQTGYRIPPVWKNGTFASGRENHPVAFVSWYDAKQYCRWAGKRLPTEAEWEKSARGPDGLEYPWGNAYESDRANTGDSEANDTLPVGRIESGKSPYGVYDLIGNVGEWVEDWYQPYPGNSQTSPLFGERLKVIRGGSWGGGGGHYTMGLFYRAAHRLFADPLDRFPDTGFRCALSG